MNLTRILGAVALLSLQASEAKTYFKETFDCKWEVESWWLVDGGGWW